MKFVNIKPKIIRFRRGYIKININNTDNNHDTF